MRQAFENFFASHTNRVAGILFVSLILAIVTYFVDHEIVRSTIADYTNQKLVLSVLVFAVSAVVLHVIVPDA